MAGEFTAQLSQPGAVTGSNVIKPSAAAAIGSGLSGLADIFDVGLKEYHKDRVEKAGLELENQLTPLAQAVGQGKMSSDEMLMRSSNIVSSAINKNPHISKDLRERAQTVLGVLPSAEIVKSAQKDEDVIKTARTNLKLGFVAEAAKSGVAVFKTDGSGELDLEASAEQGAKLSAADEKMKRLSADLDATYKVEMINRTRQGTPATLSLADRQAITIGQVNKILTPTVNARLNSLFQNMGTWINANKALAEPQQEAAAKQEWARQKFSINQMVENYIAGSDHAFTSDETHAIRQNVNEMLEKYDSVFTGNFANIKVNTELVQMIKNRSEQDFNRIAPTASALINFGGPQVAPQVLAQAWQANSIGNTALVDEGQALVNHFLRVAKDPTVPTTEPRQLEVIQSGVGAIENKGAVPEPAEMKTWGNGKQNLLDSALSSKNPTDIRNASDLMTTPQALGVLDEFKKDPAQQPQGQLIGRKLLQLNTQNILKNGLQVKQRTQDTGSPMAYGEFGAAEAKPGTVTWTPVYSPTTGQFEIQTTGTNLPPPADMARTVRSLNNSLNSLERLQEYGNDADQEMNIRQFKQKIVEGAGVPIKPGDQPVEMPGEEQSSKAEEKAMPNEIYHTGLPSAKPMEKLHLTPQEEHLYEHHVNNLLTGNAYINEDGSVSTIRNITVEAEGRTYVIPTVYEGKILSNKAAIARAKEAGLDNWPSYSSEVAAKRRYEVQMHNILERDTDSSAYQVEVVD